MLINNKWQFFDQLANYFNSLINYPALLCTVRVCSIQFCLVGKNMHYSYVVHVSAQCLAYFRIKMQQYKHDR